MQTQTSNTLHNAVMEAGSKDRPSMLAPDWQDIEVLVSKGSPITTTERIRETYKNVSQDIRDQLNAEAEAVQIILTGIDNDIYSTVDACPNACEMWKAIERLKQGESINIKDLETNLYWEFGKFTSQDGESLESYYSRFYKMMNELIRNQCKCLLRVGGFKFPELGWLMLGLLSHVADVGFAGAGCLWKGAYKVLEYVDTGSIAIPLPMKLCKEMREAMGGALCRKRRSSSPDSSSINFIWGSSKPVSSPLC
nr:retrotransposon protein, putative, Ty1-copia subclass [Tanacetum cinerariifolium]